MVKYGGGGEGGVSDWQEEGDGVESALLVLQRSDQTVLTSDGQTESTDRKQ